MEKFSNTEAKLKKKALLIKKCILKVLCHGSKRDT